MKKYIINILVFTIGICQNICAQDFGVQIQSPDMGIVELGQQMTLIVRVNNNGSTAAPTSRLRPQISIPSYASINVTQSLPSGWSILNQSTTSIRLCNSGDAIPANSFTDINIVITGTMMGTGANAGVNLGFSNGTCNSLGGITPTGDNPANNSSTAPIVVAVTAPLQLIEFTGKEENCNTSLFWKTVNEENTKNFEIERSALGSNTWEAVGTVVAAGRSAQEKQYSFKDLSTSTFSAGKFQYRLKMNNLDNTFTYSEIIVIKLNCKKDLVSVYPNPVNNGFVIIQIDGEAKQFFGIISNMQGKNINQFRLVKGNNKISTDNLQSGIYLLTITTEFNEKSVWRLIVNN